MKAILTNGREIVDATEVKDASELLELNRVAYLAAGRSFIWRAIPCNSNGEPSGNAVHANVGAYTHGNPTA